MPLTPEDVSNKRFTPVRLREGYDMSEVDQFLDEIEAELGRLTKENDELRSKVSSAQTPAEAPVQRVVEPPAAEPEAPTTTGTGTTTAVASSASEAITVSTVPEASNAAARLLEIAARNADELVDEAQGDADRILGEARSKAERLETETREKAEKVESDARQRGQMLDQETSDRRQQMFGELERERGKLNSEVEDLRAFEREYRSRLRSYFTQQLEELDSGEGAGQESETPQRLRSVLGDDD